MQHDVTAVFAKPFAVAKPLIAIRVHAFDDSCGIMNATVRTSVWRKFIKIVRLDILLDACCSVGANTTDTLNLIVHAKPVCLLIQLD
jgi:hypothetical protein